MKKLKNLKGINNFTHCVHCFTELNESDGKLLNMKPVGRICPKCFETQTGKPFKRLRKMRR